MSEGDLVFGPEYDEEDVQEQLKHYQTIGEITMMENQEDGTAAYMTKMYESPLEGPDGEMTNSQLLFQNICALIEEYLNSNEH